MQDPDLTLTIAPEKCLRDNLVKIYFQIIPQTFGKNIFPLWISLRGLN